MAHDAYSTLYVADTNVLIDLYRRRYPPSTFPTLWRELEKVITEGRFVVPEDVKRELAENNDSLYQWLAAKPFMVKDFDSAQAIELKAVLKRECKIVCALLPSLSRQYNEKEQAHE